MNQLVAVTSYKSVGATFLDWSILYLAGLDHHYNSKKRCMVTVPDDPVISTKGVINAHHHDKNHPCGMIETVGMLPDLRNNGAAIQTLYPHALHLDLCYKRLNLDMTQLPSSETDRARAQAVWLDDYLALLDACLDQDLSLIYIDADPAPLGYYWNMRSLDRFLLSDRVPKNSHEVRAQMDDFYFAQSQEQWRNMGLTDIWDQRERMALDCRPFDRSWFPRIGMDRPYLRINCQDLWNLAPDVLRTCFEYLERSIHEPRWKPWLAVAQAWQRKQHQLLCFFHDLEHVIDATLNGWYHPLPNLELWQEAIIQHCLIYKHGYNLKTWQLRQFPDNTQKLNLLLEPNMHQVPKIY